MVKESKQEQKIEEKKKKDVQAQKPKQKPEQEISEALVRILGYDIPSSRNIYAGLTYIKGVSWAISNAVCIKMNIPKTTKVGSISKEDVKKIEDFLKALDVYDFMKNRRSDPETGETKHYFGTDLEMKRDFDIRRLKKIRSYRGLRHSVGLPSRGQRTKSHFRSKGKAAGVKKKTK